MQGKLHSYHLTRELAKKYSHVTYLASPTEKSEQHVILKLFASSLFRFPQERENLLSKAQRLKKLDHPHLVPLLDMGIEQNQPFVVREYVPTRSLRSHLKERSSHPLELQKALSIVSQVGSALASVHEHNIVHGSLYPENILLDAHGQAALTDFHLTNKNDARIRDQTTKEYAFCYLAPEQFTGTCTAKSDQYALGCLAYELITGQLPFAAQSLASMMGHHGTEPIPLSERRADVPPSLEVAVLKALAKDPEERFDDFLFFLEVLQSMASSPPAFPFINAPHSDSTRILSHSRQSAHAEIGVSPIRKRAAKRSVPQQPEPSQTFFNSVADRTDSGIPSGLSDISMPEWAGIIPPSEPIAPILESDQFISLLSEDVDPPSNGDNESPNQPLKEQSHTEASVTLPSVLSSHEIGMLARGHTSTVASNANMTSADSPDAVASQSLDDAVFSSEPHSNANQALSHTNLHSEVQSSSEPSSGVDPLTIASLNASWYQQDAHDSWLPNLFEEQTSTDLPLTSPANLEQEQHESMVSLHRDRSVSRQTQPNRGKVFGLVLLCLIIVASGTYAAFFLSGTSKPDRLVHPTQVVMQQPRIPVQHSMTPPQLATPTATIQPTPQIIPTPAVIPTFTPAPTPVMLRTTAIDDSIEGTGLNQFNYVGNNWNHCTGGCNGNYPHVYNGSVSWDGTADDYMMFSFTGIQIKFYAGRDQYGGIGTISLDGGSETEIDCYSASFLGDQLMWTSPMVPEGSHTLKLRVSGTKDSGSQDYDVSVDRVDVLS